MSELFVLAHDADICDSARPFQNDTSVGERANTTTAHLHHSPPGVRQSNYNYDPGRAHAKLALFARFRGCNSGRNNVWLLAMSFFRVAMLTPRYLCSTQRLDSDCRLQDNHRRSWSRRWEVGALLLGPLPNLNVLTIC